MTKPATPRTAVFNKNKDMRRLGTMAVFHYLGAGANVTSSDVVRGLGVSKTSAFRHIDEALSEGLLLHPETRIKTLDSKGRDIVKHKIFRLSPIGHDMLASLAGTHDAVMRNMVSTDPVDIEELIPPNCIRTNTGYFITEIRPGTRRISTSAHALPTPPQNPKLKPLRPMVNSVFELARFVGRG